MVPDLYVRDGPDTYPELSNDSPRRKTPADTHRLSDSNGGHQYILEPKEGGPHSHQYGISIGDSHQKGGRFSKGLSRY